MCEEKSFYWKIFKENIKKLHFMKTKKLKKIPKWKNKNKKQNFSFFLKRILCFYHIKDMKLAVLDYFSQYFYNTHNKYLNVYTV